MEECAEHGKSIKKMFSFIKINNISLHSSQTTLVFVVVIVVISLFPISRFSLFAQLSFDARQKKMKFTFSHFS